MVKSGSFEAAVFLAWLLVSGCGGQQPMARQESGGKPDRAAGGVEAGKTRASGHAGVISDETLSQRGLMTLWVKSPSEREGPIRAAFLRPEGIFAVSRPRSDVRSWRLIRYNLDDGLPRWFYDLDEPLEHPPVAYHYGPSPEGPRPDELFILQKDVIRCLDLQYGAEMWRVQLPFPVSCAPVVDDSQYYVGSYDRRVHAMPKKKSLESWSYITGGEIKSSGALGGGGEIYFASTDKSVYRFQPSSGWVPGKSWQFATGGRVLSSPIFFSRWLYVGSTDFKLYSFEVDGSRAWEFPVEAPIADTPMVVSYRPDKPLVLCISQDERRGDEKKVGWALDAKTGQELWHRDHVQQVLAVGKKAIYLLPEGGSGRSIVAVDGIKGSELFSLPVEGFDIIPQNDADHGMNQKSRGVIYLVSKSGLIQAIREKP